MTKKPYLMATASLLLFAIGSIACLLPGLFFPSVGGAGLQERYRIGGKILTQKELIYFYNDFSHAVFILSLLLTTLYLVRRIYESTDGPYLVIDKSAIKSGLETLRRDWLTVAVFLVYAVAMAYETSFYYVEIVGWYAGVYTQDLLSNFQLNQELISETMRRNDFRFFPLAHQDLQVIGWFTPYIKVWMLISALELFGIVYFAKKLIAAVSHLEVPYLLLAASLLFLLNAGTAAAFFQLVYSERMVVLFFSLYVYIYYRYRETRHASYLYSSLLIASLGIFFKDTAIILFAGLPFFYALFDIAARNTAVRVGPGRRATLAGIRKSYWLELMIAGLAMIWLVLYLFLSFLPSLAAGTGAYKESARFRFDLDLSDTRLYIVFLMLATRPVLIALGKAGWCILDSLNATAAVYALAICVFAGYASHSYMVLPIYYVGLLDILYLLVFLYTWLLGRTKTAKAALVLTGLCLAALLSFETLAGRNYIDVISAYKQQQVAWRKTLDRTDKLLRGKRDRGEAANLIFTRSWLRAHRHLNRLKYDRLVFFDPEHRAYVVMDGKYRGKPYLPQPGDLFINVDKTDLSFLGHEMDNYRIIYEFDEKMPNAKVYEHK